MNKICCNCKENKDVSNFHKNKSRPDGLQAQCKICKNKGNDEYIKKNYEKYMNYHKDRYNINYDYICSIKKNCVKCNEDRFWVLDFHHLNPSEKDKGVSELLNHSFIRLKNEVSKCIILCRNCHSDFHYLEKQNNINIKEYLE